MSNPVLKFVEEHPMTTGVAVFGVGLIILLMMGSSQGGGNSGQAQAASAYYAAESADAQAGDAVQIAQINANAATTQSLGSDAASVENNSTWSSTDQADTASNNATSIALAPYAVQSQTVAALNTALQAPNVSSSTNFGIGNLFGHVNVAKTTTSANPVAVSASSELQQLVNGFNVGH